MKFTFDNPVRSAPAVLDDAIVDGLLDACRNEGLDAESVPSSAGHDAAIFANSGIPAAMVFVRNRHGSHNPDEAMEMDDFMVGYAVLRRFLSDLAP